MATERPVVVIVGGGWHTPDHYSKLTKALEAAGHEVHCPSHPSMKQEKPYRCPKSSSPNSVDMLELWQQVGVAALIGLTSHWTYFIHGEHDLAAAKIAGAHIVAAIFIAYLKRQYESLTIRQAAVECLAIDAAYAAALFSSILFFRLFCSPLRHVPGPLHLRFTKLTHMLDIAHRRNYEILHDLHLKYGDVVRTGPNEVTVFGLEAYSQVHGPQSKCGRAAYYNIVHPMVSLDTTRDEEVHAYRPLEQAEPIIYSRAAELLNQLHKHESQSLNISAWLEYYTIDVMGLFGLTIDFNNLAEGEHPILGIYHMAHHLLGPLAAAPWLKHLMMEQRQNIIGHVLNDAEKNGGVEANWNFVLGDFVLVIIAGSDPVCQILANMMYYLICKPENLARIREELASIDIKDYKALQHLPHSNAVIYETLRLNPAVPSAGLRLPPRGGMTINGIYIPDNTTIVTPQHSLMRGQLSFTIEGRTDDRYFEKPEEWAPERFTTRPELILNKNAFIPWTIEIRVAAACIFIEFDFDFAPGEDRTRIFTEATDFFTTTPGPLYLVLRSRENS
ncbi:Tryprostatin B 6-hydroxylase [Tolypocladium ophioglossoides CBS 100239]|uniref:Tryprostatin B 6-hydroxylase n=1 Tax=Tolypocladium ophioglossoides (strain CBS 100239) TaxID=1163406 RepID=A0A0L0MZI0_TOLOC|nr:Tryprostatin B 6-hydroxylase [Tolypocladium ophioglossoides CBS 100239]